MILGLDGVNIKQLTKTCEVKLVSVPSYRPTVCTRIGSKFGPFGNQYEWFFLLSAG